MGSPSVNHGPCRHCGRAILYLGALYCSPKCNFAFIATEGAFSAPAPEPATEVVEPEPEAVDPEPEPDPEPAEPVSPDPEEEAPSGMMGFLQSPPDEAPTKRRVYF